MKKRPEFMHSMKLLSVLLSISLGANLWFVWRDYESSKHKNVPATNIVRPSISNNNALGGAQDALRSNDSSEFTSIISSHNSSEKDFRDSKESYLKHLLWLANQQHFQVLEYEVSAYLRIYPQDIDAVLLEALAYYHNKPLNIALVHYHELLSQPLNNQQRADVEKLIAVNTTRIIQQFSGDGAWDLLAKFLEPLIQIDPRNRQYLMALARAYGMQQQMTLMEDILANFLPDDTRANRLRNEIFARLERQSDETPEQSRIEIAKQNPTPTESRVPDVLLTQNRGRFMTQARVQNTVVNLLIDTGASTTAISDLKFDSISPNQVEFLGLFNVSTAGGLVEAPIYKIDQFILGQQKLDNISVLVLPSENLSTYDGLLGMNVLSQFDMVYEASSQTMRMYKKR